jgi:hypothetical protein
MAFSGKTTNEAFAVSQVQEDVAAMVAALSPKETPFLDFLGDSDRLAISTKHEYWQDYMLPNYIINSGAINSATAVTAFQTNGLSLALTEGTLLENESAAPELMQVVSIVGANSIVVSRNYGGGGVGSLVAGAQIYVRAMAGVEGQDHNGSGVRRLGNRLANTVGYFNIPFAASGTQLAINEYGNDSFDNAVAKGLVDVLHQLEKEVVRGVLNSTNSLGTTSATRTMQGIRGFVTTINSSGAAVAVASFSANPHTYIGNIFDSMFQNGAPESDSWAIIAGRTLFRDISNMNDTKIEDTSSVEQFKRVIRRYTGPFGSAEVILSRVLAANELMLVPRERVKIVPLQGRSFSYETLAKTGDNVKGQITGEYTVEVHHESAMARLRTT